MLFLNISNGSLTLKLSLFSYVFVFFHDSAAAIVLVKDNNATAVSEKSVLVGIAVT